MCENGVKRLIFMAEVGVYNEIPDKIDGKDNLDNEPEQIPNRKAADVVEASILNYTVLRHGYLISLCFCIVLKKCYNCLKRQINRHYR